VKKSNTESADAVAAADNAACDTVVDTTQNVADTSTAAEKESEPQNNNDIIIPDTTTSPAPSTESDGGSSSSDDASDIAIADKDIEEDEDEDLQATPGHLHALANRKSPTRLLPKVHSDSKLTTDKLFSPAAQRRRSASRSVNSSRSSSPSQQQQSHHSIPRSGSIGLMMSSSDNNNAVIGKDNTTTLSSNSITINPTSAAASYASSSLDGKFDPDLLLDRLGFIDLDPPLPHEIRCGPLAAPGSIDGKSNNAGGLTPVNERLSDETLEDCHAFQDLVMIDKTVMMMSSTMSMPSVAHSSLSGMRSDMSVGSIGSVLSMGSFTKGSSAVAGAVGGGSAAAVGGYSSREGSVAGGSCVGDGELSVLLGTLDEVGEEEEGSMGSR